jgi:LPS O-antigen subunit length determinant protein (WzzB/FepE family)
MGTPQASPSDHDDSRRRPSSADERILLVDLLLTLSRGRGLIVLSILAFGLLGVLYAVSLPAEYTATSKVVREAGAEGGGQGLPQGLSSVQGLGLDLGGGGAGLTPTSYPEIATSREVRLAVARDTFYFPSTGRRTTFVRHVNRPGSLVDRLLRYALWLPWTLTDAVGSALSPAEPAPVASDSTDTLMYPTDAEERAIAALSDQIAASAGASGPLDEGSLMTIATTATDPTLAARLNERTIAYLRTRVRELRTKTTRKNLAFIETRFEEVQQELDAAEDRLSKFLERNRSVLAGGNEPQLAFRRERLRREVRFKEQLYSQLQTQVTQTRLQLQREQPVVTVAEKPAPPTVPSAPNWPFTIVLSLVLGTLFGVAGTFVRAAFRRQGDTARTQEKMDEVRGAFRPSGLVQGVREELGVSTER